jgi:hypothetical protein
MNGYQIFELLPKKDNGLVSFSTVARAYGLSIGSLNRALSDFDTGEGINSQAVDHLVSIGLITPQPSISDIEVLEGELLDSQLAQFGVRSVGLPSPRPSAPLAVSAEGYSLNGKLQALLALQAENQALKTDIETLRENQANALRAWEEMTILEAELTAENSVLRKQRTLEEIEAKALKRQLKVMGVVGKSLE